MRIGFVSTRLAGVDGVSLETVKMAKILEDTGHECFYLAGELDNGAQPGWEVPAMHFNDSVARAIYNAVFMKPRPAPEIFRRIYDEADILRQTLDDFIDTFEIDLLVPQNACTIPMNIQLGVAIADVIKRRQIKTICHHHDFYWERDRFVNNDIQDILNEAFPPNLKTVKHMVISHVMQRRLRAWRGIDAYYLPNVCDFENPPAAPDEYALCFRKDFGLKEDDLIVLQPTRLVRRKAIEKSIELVRKLNDPQLVLVITGYEGDELDEYGKWVREEADRSGIRYVFIGDYIGTERSEKNGRKIYTLWDIYPQAHFITYPSLYEGFGNALIETIYFRKPFVVHRYPAYVSDIGGRGVKGVEFFYDITDDVVRLTRKIIENQKLRERIVEHNYRVGLRHFSYRTLRLTLYKVLYDITHE